MRLEAALVENPLVADLVHDLIYATTTEKAMMIRGRLEALGVAPPSLSQMPKGRGYVGPTPEWSKLSWRRRE